MTARTKVTTTTTVETCVELGHDELLAALDAYLSDEFGHLPRETRLRVQVPGGGDWSNMMLDIGANGTPLLVDFVTRRQP